MSRIFMIMIAGLSICLPVKAAPAVDNWIVIKEAFFSGRDVKNAENEIGIQAPSQAEDASLVPFSFKLQTKHPVNKVYLFTDANPIVHTATFHFPSQAQQFELATRIRLEKDSQVRIVAETEDGQLMMKSVAIKTPGGGCGGGGYSDEATLRATSGQMKVKFPNAGASLIFQIKHPMRTGFERTPQGYYAKAWYISRINFTARDVALLNVDVGPGIGSDPYFQFDWNKEVKQLQVHASDNEGLLFMKSFDSGNFP